MAEIKTPHLDKMLEHNAETQAVHDFLEWLATKHIELATYAGEAPYLTPVMGRKDELLAEWKGIDLAGCEVERREIIANL